MQENSSTLMTADLHLHYFPDASPMRLLVLNGLQEFITAHPPARRLFDRSPNAYPAFKCSDCRDCANRLRTTKGCGSKGLP